METRNTEMKTDEQIARHYAEEYMGKPAPGQHAIHEEDVAALVPFIVAAIQSARGADGRRLDWLEGLFDKKVDAEFLALGRRLGQGQDLRSAIDSAMEGQK
jgi:hypothetical protein